MARESAGAEAEIERSGPHPNIGVVSLAERRKVCASLVGWASSKQITVKHGV